LKAGGVLNTPVGQLIISAAVIDDMIALIVLSILESLKGTIDAASVLVPIISACAFLVIGGYIAIYVLPGYIEKWILNRTESQYHGKIELAIMFGILLGMMPATHYAKASFLMGAFISGLAFCTSHDLHATFVQQFKRVLQWLMRIFFAASIGFQVPIKDFGNGTVIWQGLVFTLALLGKIATGFMVPNFTHMRRFKGKHLRDCLITGWSMAAEGEFAFVIAVFSVDSELINKDVYASVVLAVLLSTIIPPFALRYTISYYNKKAEERVGELAESEMKKKHDLEAVEADTASTMSASQRENQLVGEIRNARAVFFCIQTQSESRWGLMLTLMKTMGNLGLDVIDHRSWHPRGVSTTLVNEIYCKDTIEIKEKGRSQEVLEERINQIREALEKAINQPKTSRVKVQRWYPGVVEEIIESVHDKKMTTSKKNLNLEERLLKEATEKLDQKQSLQTHATKEKTVEEILASMRGDKDTLPPVDEAQAVTPSAGDMPRKARRRRQKMRSTPVVGGGLFGESSEQEKEEKAKPGVSQGKKPGEWKPNFDFGRRRGHKAEIIVQGESYDIRISDETLRALRTGFSGDMVDSRGISVVGAGLGITPDRHNVVNQLQGYIRTPQQLGAIMEEADSESEASSMHPRHDHDHHDNGDLPPV
jgi:hypothetical protein